MVRKLLVLVLVLGVASVAMGQGAVQLNRQVPLGSAPSINGILGSEWNDALAIPFDTASALANGGAVHNGGNGAAPDFDATYYMKWDASNLYIAVDVIDDEYLEDPDPSNGTNGGDEAQLGFTLGTPSSGGAVIFDMAASTSGGGAQLYEHDPWGHGGYGLTAASQIAGFVGVGSYSMEVAIAWADLGYSPLAGDMHSMYLIHPDFDSGGDTHTMSIGEGTWFGEYLPPDMNIMTLVVPEPATMIMLSLGGIALIRRKR